MRRSISDDFLMTKALRRRRAVGAAFACLVCVLPAAVEAAEAAGTGHSCTIIAGGGGVECFGLNDRGQLGDGTLTDRTIPTAVQSLPGAAVELEAGDFFSCALVALGALYCWGDNVDGELGDGTLTQSSIPTAVLGLPGPVGSFSAGLQHACAVSTGGGVSCWGNNDFAQLGDGSFTNRSSATAVVGLPGAIDAVALGEGHSCALTAAGQVYCWGGNEFGELGDGTRADRTSPTPVDTLPGDVVAIAAGGYHTCALRATGTVLCWGDNIYGQAGQPGFDDELLPAVVNGLAGPVDAIEAGESFTCALLAGGSVQCWGDNFEGQLGDGSFTERYSPSEVAGLAAAAEGIALGAYHGCARLVGGALLCWGDNFYGQLGNGSTGTEPVPVLALIGTAVPSSLASRFGFVALLALLGSIGARRREKTMSR